ncbi:MAG: phosphoenolpyruvate carboxykinase (ATP), partial [Actinomycetia bacterium]|nr:phosphoenolpyruvate carboxykinase (ATP) [Actinomycetes bacterium]
AELLAQRMADNKTRCILLNTGWSGGPHGEGQRMSLKATRALLDGALDGELDSVELEKHPILGLKMPTTCPGVDSEILNPRDTWDDPEAYDKAAIRLREMFRANYRDQGYADWGIASAM